MHRLLKAAAATASGVALTFSVTIATELPASAADSCKTTFSQYHTITPGTSGSQARAAQCLLRSANYRVQIDGSFSSADAAQLKKFQRAARVAVTGNVYASSWTALLSRGSQPSLHRGDQGESVRRLQRALTASGRPVPVTGYYGTITTDAVKSVQHAVRLSPTGATRASVWRTLQSGDPIVKKVPTKKAPAKKVAKKSVKASAAGAKVSASSRGSRAVAFARRQLGDRYVWGAAGPNAWDCSGLTKGAWRSAGVGLPHSAKQQSHRGRRVSKSQLRPGDLVFYYRGIRHVAIYAGGGKVIHAPRPGKSVRYASVNSMPFQGARRVG